MSAQGGNARTIMIAALSPADSNFEETLRCGPAGYRVNTCGEGLGERKNEKSGPGYEDIRKVGMPEMTLNGKGAVKASSKGACRESRQREAGASEKGRCGATGGGVVGGWE
jgi:hypothetical protein